MNNTTMKKVTAVAIALLFVISFSATTLAKKDKKEGRKSEFKRPEMNEVTFTGVISEFKPKPRPEGKDKGNDEGKHKKKRKPRAGIILTNVDGVTAMVHLKNKAQMEMLKELIGETVIIVGKGFKPREMGKRPRGKKGDEAGERQGKKGKENKGKKNKKGKEGKQKKKLDGENNKDGKKKSKRPTIIIVEATSIEPVKK